MTSSPHRKAHSDPAVDAAIAEHGAHPDAIVSIYRSIQARSGYLTNRALGATAAALRIPEASAFGVATFYSQFYLSRRGRHTVRVCRGTACHVRGGKNVLKAVQQALGIGENQTTPDYQFTFETVACLGACALSPVLLVDKKYYGKLTPAKVEKILKQHI